jgi:hypothetical protein
MTAQSVRRFMIHFRQEALREAMIAMSAHGANRARRWWLAATLVDELRSGAVDGVDFEGAVDRSLERAP